MQPVRCSGGRVCRERDATSPLICFHAFPFLPPPLSLSAFKKNSSFMDQKATLLLK